MSAEEEGTAPEGVCVPRRLDRRAALSWCLHDLANTIFSAVVVTVFLPLWVRNTSGLAWPTGVVGTLSMVAAAFVVPALGGAVDRTGRARAWLIRAYTGYSLLAVAMSLAAWMPVGIWPVLALFALANFLYQASLVLYNSLLPAVAPPARQGFISGLGVGLGYLGQPLALGLCFLLVQRVSSGWTFALAGVLVLLFSLPLQAWVPERTVADPRALDREGLAEEWRQVLRTLRSLPETPSVLWFLVGNFLCVDVLNTAIFWTSVYLVHGVGMSQGTMLLTVVVANVTAFALGLFLGWLTDRVGPRATYLLAAVCLLSALMVLALARDPRVVQVTLWTVGAAGLGGIWVAGRKLLLDLVPPERAGAYFGLYGLTNKGAAFGVAVFAVLSDLFGFDLALMTAAAPLLVGILFLLRVRVPGEGSGGKGSVPTA